MTAIVGPNGCGKSNLADALTWVLGEQSAKSLRGEKMEDVIFSGSDARKPTGAAEVRLRLSGVASAPAFGADESPVPLDGASNGHGNGKGRHIAELMAAVREVEVTRRLYRSGESEYLIDGQICRLRDIHELLMDTGLGAKAYSIIEQGKIGMILSSRPSDRRALIEEAAGITKYKARRRAAELKLEAAQHNLTRIDDIVFEVAKQRGSLKRQAAKAKRYGRLREEMRRWEKVLFARRYRSLADAIEAARARLSEAREHEAAASTRLAAVESELAALRLQLVEVEVAATRVREAAHARELEINRREQQIALDTQQAAMLDVRSRELAVELAELEARREPERLLVNARRTDAVAAARARDDAADLAVRVAARYADAQQQIEMLDRSVERARDDVFAVVNTVTALDAAIQSAGAHRERAAEALGRLDAEAADLRTEHARAVAARTAANAALVAAHEALETTRAARAAREAELANARIEHEWRARDVRSREHELASMTARLRSLEELDAQRAGFSDAARMILAQANGNVGQLGALADFLDVEPRYERAVEACLGDLLQHVLVEQHEQVAAGLTLVRHEDAGRCGFIVVGAARNAAGAPDVTVASGAPQAPGPARATDSPDPPGLDSTTLSRVVRVVGGHDEAIRSAIGEALIVGDFDEAARAAAASGLRVATLDGDVFHAAHVVSGGGKAETRGILTIKREIKELRDTVAAGHATLEQLATATLELEQAVACATAAIAALTGELHGQEKLIVGIEGHEQRAVEEERRLDQRAELVAVETQRTRDEIGALDARQTEARESISRLHDQKRDAEAMLAQAQRALADARDSAELLSRAATDARASHATLVERASGADREVIRLEEAARQLEQRVETCATELALMRDQRERLLIAAVEGQRLLDVDVAALDELRGAMRAADASAVELKGANERQEVVIRDARRAVDAVRALVAELDVTRATADADLTHLAQQALDGTGETLDDIRADVERMEAAGDLEPDRRAIHAVEMTEPDDVDDDVRAEGAEADEPPVDTSGPMTAEEAIAALRAKIDRVGPVNMMAIEQFDELEQRHTFLTTQRQDLVDSIAQTNEAIRRIDETTHARFREAFSVINANFQQTFSTLFGGGRAGLTLLDEADPLESGIDIVASPPGKRLQNVQLLSGGEKALAAIALMFAIFRYKPSPFCLLDEIDAPLDDANIGRFVEMLRGMLDRTQFIIITHNRKTMEIANRLYGVTMEEPGVSKLISVQLN
ncbi:MAG: chromosome segregation protein SMC [Acidobacteria bacterium]|nr:chromosome segregation protein SMC [Acidobacteriota bacterium]